MLQAIVTKYHGPTNSRGSRITASAFAGRVTVHYDHALNPDQNHAKAAEALVRKLGWTPSEGKGYAGLWVGGASHRTGVTYVFTGEGNQGNGWPSGTCFEIEA